MAGFDVSLLTAYTAKATEILRESVLLSDNVIEDYTIQPGIKYKEYLNFLDATPVAQAAACGLSASGSNILTEKEITVAGYAFRDSFCVVDLEAKALPLMAGSFNGLESSVEETLTLAQMEKIEDKLWYDRWFGRTGSGNLINGWYYYANAATDNIETATTGDSWSAVTISNINDLVEEFVAAISADMWAKVTETEHLTLYMSIKNYNIYKQYLIKNFGTLAVTNVTQEGPTSCWIAGYENQIVVKGIKAFDTAAVSNNPMILTYSKNLVLGVDEISEMSSAKWVYDEVTDYLWFKVSLKQGCQIKFTPEIVTNF